MTIPNKTFVMRSDYSAYLSHAIERKLVGSKQNLVRHDAINKRNIIIHGDFTNYLISDSAAGGVWAYDPVADVVGGAANIGLTNISPRCHGPGATTHFGGNDGASAGIDYRDGVLWTTPGSDFGVTHGNTCSTSGIPGFPSIPGSTFYSGLLKMDLATGAWTGVSTIAAARDNSMAGGFFDPVQRCLIGISGSDLITRIFVDNDPVTKQQTAVNYTALGIPSAGTYDAGGNEVEPAFDWVGRWGYFFGAGRPNSADPQPWRYYLFRFNLDNPSVQTRLADPPFLPPTYVNAYGPCHIRSMQFDTRNRKVVYFYRRTGGARKVHGVAAYDPVTNAWETIPIVKTENLAVTGCSIGYDSTNNVFVGFGTAGYSAGEDPQDQEADAPHPSSPDARYWLWRYA